MYSVVVDCTAHWVTGHDYSFLLWQQACTTLFYQNRGVVRAENAYFNEMDTMW